ncbi:hypothetical protein C6Y40_03890 [Alteromonas alba]|uniref:Pectate lyase superfamily protein domain-containing protein n=1 Tax=Alteromonas alba TaxID=2079529 RepID=A0A2S9VF70_9ALTE|nr:hypothetical protein [Alteromonas alba]PRO74945.1 hypothetical protein C6Y40_03890 [Alteromonas alba]
MSTYKLSDVTASYGSQVVQINNADSVLGALKGSLVQIGTQQAVFLDAVDVENSQFSLTFPWPYPDAVNVECTIAPISNVIALMDVYEKAKTTLDLLLAQTNVTPPTRKVASVSEAISMVNNGDLSDGDEFSTTAYRDGWAAQTEAPKGGNSYQVKESTSSGARPAHDGGEIIHVGSTEFYLLGLFPTDPTPHQFGAYGDGANLDTVALQNWLAYSVKTGVGHVPKGEFLYDAELGLIDKPVSIYGAGKTQSLFKALPTFTGWTIRIRETGFVVSGWNKDQTTYDFNGEVSGVNFSEFALSGNRGNGSSQGGILFLDRNDNVNFNSVWIHHFSAGGLIIGVRDIRASAYIRESEFYDLQVRMCGDRNNPAMILSSDGTGDATNQVNFYGLKVVWSHGEGLVIMNDNTNIALRRVYFFGCMVHGQEGSLLEGRNQITIKGSVNLVSFYGLRINATEINSYSISLEGHNGLYPTAITADIDITTGYGGGIQVLGGRNHRFNVKGLFVDGSELSIGVDVDGPIEMLGAIKEDWEIVGDEIAIGKWVSSYLSEPGLPARFDVIAVGLESAVQPEIHAFRGNPHAKLASPAGSVILNRTGTPDKNCDSMYSKVSGDGKSGYFPVQLCLGGTTAERPVEPTLDQIFIDHTLGYVIYWDGTEWRPAFNLGGSDLPDLTIDVNSLDSIGYSFAADASTNLPGSGGYFIHTWGANGEVNNSVHFAARQGPVNEVHVQTIDDDTPNGWSQLHHTDNLVFAQNNGTSSVANNGTTSGANLNPSKSGNWRNVSGNSLAVGAYGLWMRV